MENFYGNPAAVAMLEQIAAAGRIPQTLLFDGPEGAGKATLARRFAAMLVGNPEKIERDDLSIPENQAIIADREKWPAEKRNEDPLFFSTHPDFLTFPPDGPLRQITIPQMRFLKERARMKPLKGRWRVFLIDQIDRAGESAANSLLKTLEEPPEHLIVIMTARNPYDLLPTIRSRAVPLRLGRLSDEEMRGFIEARGLDDPERRLRLAGGSPGAAISLDLETYDRQREAMLALLRTAAGKAAFGEWLKHGESVAARRSEKLDAYLEVLYLLLGDLARVMHGGGVLRNEDIRKELEALGSGLPFEWLRRAVAGVDELVELVRRNIQKPIALDALAVGLRTHVARAVSPAIER